MREYLLRAQYSTTNGKIEYFTLMSLEEPADFDDAVNEESDLDDEAEAEAEAEAVSAALIEAWLDQLAKTQPQYGPLLQSTVDTVGQLPAVDDDGHCYTVSHDNYWFAAGYAKAYATQRADGRRIEAVLAEMKAKKVKDELTMTQKEDEANFWESVGSWLEAVDVARMRPDPLPEWLARFNAQWN